MSVCVRASNQAPGRGRPVVDVGVDLPEGTAPTFVAVDIVRFNTHPAADPEAGVRSRYVVEARPKASQIRTYSTGSAVGRSAACAPVPAARIAAEPKKSS